MSLYVRLYCSFFSHRKTRRLRAKIGNDAFWVPPRLWAYAATNQPDGDFKDYSAEDIAAGIGYPLDAQALLQALLEAEFIDEDMKIHDWAVHSGFHELYAARARKAASVRWEKERTKEREGTELSGAELSKHSSSSASSNASSITVNGKRPPIVFDKELQNRIKLAEDEIQGIRLKGNLLPADSDKIKELRKKQRQWKDELLSR